MTTANLLLRAELSEHPWQSRRTGATKGIDKGICKGNTLCRILRRR